MMTPGYLDRQPVTVTSYRRDYCAQGGECDPCVRCSMSDVYLPEYIAGFKTAPAKFYGGRFKQSPSAIVLHCPATLESCLEYLMNPGDGRRVSAHFVWHEGEWIQMVRLDHMAWHCKAGSMNTTSYGIECAGPPTRERDEAEIVKVADLIATICHHVQTVREIWQHSELTENRTDAGFRPEQMIAFREILARSSRR